MMASGDLDLSQFGEPVKDAVRRRIMRQEVVFRDQVCELHRLYWTQKNLMRELQRKAPERKEQSDEAALVVDSWKEVKGKFIARNEDMSTGFDLRFPVDVGNAAFDKKVEDRRFVLREMSSLRCYEVIDLEEPVKSGFCIGGNAAASNGFGAPINRGGDLHSLWPPIPADVPSSSRVNNKPGLVPLGNFLHAGHSERWREQKAPFSGSGFCDVSVAAFINSSTDLTQKDPLPTSRPLLIDLNIAQDVESSHDFNNPILKFSSPSSSSSVIQHELLWRDECNKCPEVNWVVLKPDASNSALEISKGKKSEWWLPGCHSQNLEVRGTIQCQEHGVGNEAQGSDSNSSAECSGNLVGEFSGCPNSGIATSARLTTLPSGPSVKLSKPVEEHANPPSSKKASITQSSRRQASIVTSSNDTEVKQANCERSEEDTVSSHAIAQDEKGDLPVTKFLTVSQCNRMIGGRSDASSQDKSLGENSGTTQLESQVPGQADQQHEDQAVVMDFEITGAAKALVCISLQKSLSLVDKFDKTEPTIDMNGGEDKNDDPQYSSDPFNEPQPQYSSDSFESMTLKLPEIKSEHLMPSKPIENEARGDASGVNKLRRGRGRAVRDFQKDILPGMVSLSRHEICEDMHNIGYELRKNGSRKTCEDNWFVPVRSRRSRRYCASRRH